MILEIRVYPDPVLKERAVEVERVDEEIRALVDDMVETMYEAGGVGLAAPQVGRSLRIVVIDTAETPEDEGKNLLKLINPRIVESSGKLVWDEGCLSLPGVIAEINRKAEVTVEALDGDGEPFVVKGTGLLAVALQHEIDHLDGLVLLDYMGRMRRKMAAKTIQRTLREEMEADER